MILIEFIVNLGGIERMNMWGGEYRGVCVGGGVCERERERYYLPW